MRNLIAFFQRFRLFLVFLLLQVIALTLVLNFSTFAHIQFLSTTSDINGSIMSWRNDVDKHFYLEKSNQKLRNENRWLRARLKQSNYQEERGRILIDDTTYKRQYSYIPSTVIHSTYDKRNNYMTIDVGSMHGVKQGDGVISTAGVVGVVHLVNKHYSLVKTVLSKDINFDVMMEKNGAFGLLKWDQKLPTTVQVIGISTDVYIKKWSKVVTRGGSGMFPKGIPVGIVSKNKHIEGKPLWDLNVKLATDFRTIQNVYVVKNNMEDELDRTINAIPADKEEDQ